MRKNPERDAAIYQMWMTGKKIVTVATEFEITPSGVKQVLKRYRKLNNLPNGRKYAKESYENFECVSKSDHRKFHPHGQNQHTKRKGVQCGA